MKLLLLLLLSGRLYAGNLPIVGPFSGLNNDNSSITIDPTESQDTLNVEVSRDALSLNKRKGYTQYSALSVSTGPVYGSIAFKSITGDNIKVFANDRYISVSKNGEAFTTLISTATLGAKWSFCETGGTMYAFNDQYQEPWSYNGSAITYYPSMPYASLCAMTVDRMLLAGTTDFPNRLYFSKSGAITDFTVDIEPESPGFEDIGLQGDKITALFTAQAEWLIFKTNSFISYQGTNQFDLVPSVISEKIGMVDPHAIVQHEGIVYFKSSGGKLYGYASGTLTELSKKISGFVANITKESVSQKEYSSQSDFESGTSLNMDATTIAGSIKPFLYNYPNNFSTGTFDNISVVGGSLQLTSNPPIYFQNMGAESGSLLPNWYSDNYGEVVPPTVVNTDSPKWGNYQFKIDATSVISAKWETVGLLPGNYSGGTGDFTIDTTTNTFTNGYYIKFSCKHHGSVTDYFKSNQISTLGKFSISVKAPCLYDMEEGKISSGTYTSIVTTVTATSPHYGYLTSTVSTPAGYSIDYAVRYSSAINGVFSDWNTASNYSLLGGTTLQYWQNKINIQTSSPTIPTVSGFGLTFASTGYWQSPELFIGGAGNWGLFTADTSLDPASTMTFTMYTSTYVGGTATATGTTIVPGSAITASTGTYAMVKVVNSFTTATETVRLNGILLSWGFLPDKLANVFEYKGDIYFGVPYNYSTTNNRLLKFDGTTGGWNIFDMAVNSPLSLDEYVYFGSPTGGYVYQYPFGDTDNGNAINSYWKTKNFIGANPYVENQFQKISIIAGSDSGSTMDVTYTMDTTTSTTYTIDLTSSTAGFVRNNRALPIGDRGTFFNLQIGNNSSTPWSFYGASIDYKDEPWRVIPED